jgi:hypothetical protein
LADLQGFAERTLFWHTAETARNQTVMARFGTKLCTFRYLFDEKLARIALLSPAQKVVVEPATASQSGVGLGNKAIRSRGTRLRALSASRNGILGRTAPETFWP